MPSAALPFIMPAPIRRPFAIAALLGATVLAGNVIPAHADNVNNTAHQLAAPQTQAGAAATDTKGETVEQRISNLHAALKITPDEEKKWDVVAQAMRENAAAMDKIIADNRTTPPRNMSAVDDLKMYQKFSQAHVDGLKNLISAFSSLYSAMPDDQKKVADGVFQSSRQAAAAQGHAG